MVIVLVVGPVPFVLLSENDFPFMSVTFPIYKVRHLCKVFSEVSSGFNILRLCNNGAKDQETSISQILTSLWHSIL